jgi:hypothetical protein
MTTRQGMQDDTPFLNRLNQRQTVIRTQRLLDRLKKNVPLVVHTHSVTKNRKGINVKTDNFHH